MLTNPRTTSLFLFVSQQFIAQKLKYYTSVKEITWIFKLYLNTEKKLKKTTKKYKKTKHPIELILFTTAVRDKK